MKPYLHIGEFAELTGVTVKTVLHYHKVGLMDEPERSPAGYRLYGAAELNHMRTIKHLKSMGLALDQIKTMIGARSDPRSMREVLESLQSEVQAQMKTLEDRLEIIQKLLDKEVLDIEKGKDDPPTFKMINDMLGMELYEGMPELLEQDRKIYALLDDFNWEMEHQRHFYQVAEYFRDNPEQYRLIIDYNQRISALMNLPEDDPEVEKLAREVVQIMLNIPVIRNMEEEKGPRLSFEPVLDEMLNDLLSPALARFCRLFKQYWEETVQNDEDVQP